MSAYQKEPMINAGFTCPAEMLDQLDAVGSAIGASSRSAALRSIIIAAHDALPKRQQVKK